MLLTDLLKVIKMLPNNYKIGHNSLQTAILFTFIQTQTPRPLCAGRINV